MPDAAEFFAGIGLVRVALEQAGFRIVFANDIEPTKRLFYAANLDPSHFVLEDIRRIKGDDVPDIHIATASFPCTDLSLAGWRRGLNGDQSGTFWEFARVLTEMGPRRPTVVMLENVPSFATSRGGQDLADAIRRLNELGYSCDIVELDARRWVPQSRSRVFVVGLTKPNGTLPRWDASIARPPWVGRFAIRNPGLRLHAMPLNLPARVRYTLETVLERISPSDPRWWDKERVQRFVDSLSPTQHERLAHLRDAGQVTWRAAYRRTRSGRPVWEIRNDSISGCLRAVRGGSSRQAVVELGHGQLRIRWMTAREYARLMGVPDYNLSAGTEHQALFGLGDAVCVPLVAWLAQHYLLPASSDKQGAFSLVASNAQG